MPKIDGVVVLYNPNDNVIENIKSYISYIERLYVIDNSENANKKLVNQIQELSNKIKYINNGENKGIAYALNLGVKLAIQNGADWLLTMDQDSYFEEGEIFNLINTLKSIGNNKVGILSPYHLTRDKISSYKKENKIIEVLTVMTSGNLLNLKAVQEVGLFEEKYFIDYVDHEYCLRLQQFGYKVYVDLNSKIVHELGNLEFKNILWKKISITNHNYLRRYYITRNRLDVIKRYSFKNFKFLAFSLKTLKAIIVEWVKIILFEDDKIRKSKMIVRAIKDFFNNKFGKYNDS